MVNQGQYGRVLEIGLSRIFRIFFEIFEILLGTCQNLHFTHCKKLLDLCNLQWHMSQFSCFRTLRLIQFGCNQLVHRTGTKYLVILAVKSLGKQPENLTKLPRKIRFRRLILDIISEIDDHSHFPMF